MKTKRFQPKWLLWSASVVTVVATGVGVFLIFWRNYNSLAKTQEENSSPKNLKAKNLFASSPSVIDYDKPLEAEESQTQDPWSPFSTLKTQPNSLKPQQQQLNFLTNHMVFQEESNTLAYFRLIGLQNHINQWAQLVIVDADSASSTPPIQHFWKISSGFETLTVSGLTQGKTYHYWLDINGNKSAPLLLEALPLPKVLIESVDIGFDTTTVSVKNLAPLFVLKANNLAFKDTNLYLAYQETSSPNSLVQKVLITPSLAETTKVLVKNLAPNTEYKFWLTYSQGYLIQPLKQVLKGLTYNRVASDIVDPVVKLVKPNQATVGIQNLRYLPLSGKTFQFFLEPAKGRDSRIEVNSFSFSSPIINPDNPPSNTKALFNPTQGTLSLEYSFFNLTPGESYFVKVVETEQLSKEKQTYGITTRSFRTKTFESLEETPDFQTPSTVSVSFPYLSASNIIIKLPNFSYLNNHNLKVLYRPQKEVRFVEAQLHNTGSQLLAYLEPLRPNTKYEFIVEDSEANLLFTNTFTTLPSPHLDLAKTTFSLKESNLVFSLLEEYRNQPLSLKLFFSKNPHLKTFVQTLTQQSSSASPEFKLLDLKPNQIYFFQLFDSQEQLISQGEFQTPDVLAFSFAPSTTSVDFFYQKKPQAYNKNVFNNPALFLEYRKIGQPRFTKQVIHPKTDGESYGFLTLGNLQADSTYEYRFLTLQNGNFFTLGAGYFSTLAQNSLHQINEPNQVSLTKKEYVFEFSTPQHQDWNFFLEFSPQAHSLYYTTPSLVQKEDSFEADTKLFGPTKVVRKGDKLFYYFHIPQEFLAPNQQYLVKAVAKKTLNFANNVEISSTLSHLLFKTSPQTLEKAPNSDLVLLKSQPVSFYTSSAVLQLRIAASLYEEMQKSSEYEYFLTYEAKTDEAHIQEVLGASVGSALMAEPSFMRTRLFGKFQIFANTLKSEHYLQKISFNNTNATSTPNTPSPPQPSSFLQPLTYFQRSFLLDTLLPNTLYKFTLKRQKKGEETKLSEQESVFEKELQFSGYIGNTSHLESLVFDQNYIHFRFKNLAEFREFSHLYLGFRVRLEEKSHFDSQKTVELLSAPRVLGLASSTHFNDSLKNTINRFNRLKINSDNTASLSLSWKTFEKIYGVSLSEISTIDWVVMAAGQRTSSGHNFSNPDSSQQFNSWFALFQSQPEERVNPKDIILTNRILVGNNRIDAVVDLPKRFKNAVTLRYFQTPNSPRVLNSEIAPSLPEVSAWTSFNQLVFEDSQLTWQLPNTSPNSTYFFALVLTSDPSQVLWRSLPIKTPSLISDVVTNRVSLQPLQKVKTSLVSPTYLLHGLSPNLTLENAKEIDVVNPSVQLSDLEINKRYYFKVVDAKHLALSETAEFVTGEFVSLNTKNSTSSSVSLSLEGLRGLGLSFYNKQLSHLFSSFSKTPKPLTIPMLFEYRLLSKEEVQPWSQRQLFIGPNTDSYSFTIDNLAKNRTYEYRLLALNPLKPNFRVFQSLLGYSQQTLQPKSLSQVFEQISLRFLDYFYFFEVDNRILLASTFEEQLLQEDLEALLAPLREQHFLSKEFAAQLQSSFIQAVRYSFDDVLLNLETLLEAKKTLAQKLLNFFLTHFSKSELETLFTLKTKPLFKTKEQVFEEALAEESLIFLTQSAYPFSQTFKTSLTDTQLFASHDNALLVINQEVLKSLSSQKTPPKISIVLQNHHFNTFQKQTLPLSQIAPLAKTSYIFFQINELKEQFQKLSLEEQKAKFGLGLKKQIEDLEASIAKHWIVEIGQKPWNFLLFPKTSYTLSLFVSDSDSEEELFFKKSFKTQPLLEVNPLLARAPGVVGLRVNKVTGLASSQIIVFFRKHNYSPESSFEELFSFSSTNPPLPWREGQTKLLAQRWYFKVFSIPENTQSFDTYIDVVSENTEVDYVVLPYNTALAEFGVSNNEFFRNSLQKGLLRSGASSKTATSSKNTLIFEGNFAQEAWTQLTTLGELGLLTVGRDSNSQDSLEGWELPLINSLTSLSLNSTTTGESVWYKLATPKNARLKNWFVWKNPKTLERFLVYYVGVKVNTPASQPQKVVLFELHFRLMGDRISARVVASKTVTQTNTYQDPTAFEWANLVGRNVEYKLLNKADTGEYQVGGLGFQLTSSVYAKNQTATSLHRYNLTAKTEPLFASVTPKVIVRGEFSFLNYLFNSAFFESLDSFSKSMKQLWRGAKLYFFGSLASFDGWMNFQNKNNALSYSFVEGVSNSGVGIRLLYRQNSQVFGFQLTTTPYFDQNQNLSFEVRITSSPRILFLTQPQEFASLSWEEFFSLSQEVPLASTPNSPGINIGAIQFDVPLPEKELQELPNLLPSLWVNSLPSTPVTPLQQKPLLLWPNSRFFNQTNSGLVERVWYDPNFSLTHLNFSQLRPKTNYLLFYWLKTQKPYSEEEKKDVLRLLTIQERDAVFDSERGFVSFKSPSTSYQLVLKNLALNTHYSFALYEQNSLEEDLAKLLPPTPVVSDSFLSLIFANEQLFKRYSDSYEVSYRASGWKSVVNQSNFFSSLFQPFWWVLRWTARLLFLDRIFTFFSPQKQLVESSQSDPLGQSFVPKTPEGLQFPSLKEFWNWTYYYKSFFLNLQEVFGQNHFNNNSWMSRPGLDRLNRWSEFQQAILPNLREPISSTSQTSFSVFGQEPAQQVQKLREFIENNIKALRVGGLAFGVHQPGEGPWLPAFRRLADYSKLVPFNGVGNFLGYSFDSEQEVLKLFYFLPITTNTPSNLQEPVLAQKGVVFSFAILLPKVNSWAQKELANRVYAAVEAVVSAPLNQLPNLLASLKKLDFKTYQTSEFLVVESYQELVATKGKKALFISDFLFDWPTS